MTKREAAGPSTIWPWPPRTRNLAPYSDDMQALQADSLLAGRPPQLPDTFRPSCRNKVNLFPKRLSQLTFPPQEVGNQRQTQRLTLFGMKLRACPVLI
jgi:hypothetical protein